MNTASQVKQPVPVPYPQYAQRRPSISVIIPTLNEGSTIGETLRRIPRTEDVEVIIADGGSRDGTPEIAKTAGAHVVRTYAGRAHQMNAGAAVASGEILLFLHADTHLPADFESLVHETLRRPGVIAGAFRLRVDSPRWSVRIVEALANMRSKYLGMPYGDQALFLRKHYFRTAAGFARLAVMEDFEFVRRIGRWGRVAIAPKAVLTSARRWERLGVLRTTLVNQLIILAYLLGVSPSRLARWYRGAGASNGSRPKEAPKRFRWLRSFRFLWHAGAAHSRLLSGNRGN